jgi:hypothetical protein
MAAVPFRHDPFRADLAHLIEQISSSTDQMMRWSSGQRRNGGDRKAARRGWLDARAGR